MEKVSSIYGQERIKPSLMSTISSGRFFHRIKRGIMGFMHMFSQELLPMGLEYAMVICSWKLAGKKWM